MLYKNLVKKISVCSKKKLKQKEYKKNGSFKVVDQGQSLIGGFTSDPSLLVDCTLPVVVFGDHTKCVKYIDFPFVVGADGVKVLCAKDGLFPKFLYYYTLFLSEKMIDKGYARHYQFLEKMEVIIPSLEEQKRIVNQIEELFSELDSAVETLKKTKEQLAVYRQAVLKDAFGKYESGFKVPITEVVIQEKYSLAIGPFGSNLKVSDYTTKGVKLVFVKDIRSSFSREITKFVSEAKASELKPHCVYCGDLLITKMGDPPGDCCVYPFADRGIITSDCIRIKLNELKMNKIYLMHYIHSIFGKMQIKGMTQGVAQKKISLDRFKKFKVPKIDMVEQKNLVDLVQSKLSVCDNIEKIVNEALSQADAMRQSILKKAFEGGL